MSDGATRTLLVLVAWQGAWPPSVRELADATGAAPATVLARLRELRRVGLVEWEPGRSRTVRATVSLAHCH